MNRPLHVTRHAAERYRDRVDRFATTPEAVKAIRRIAGAGRACRRPRKWCRLARVATREDSLYLYSAVYPGVCLVVRGNAVVTVYSKGVCVEWRNPTIGVAA